MVKIQEKFPELIDEYFQVLMVDTIYDVLDHALVENPIPRPLGFEVFKLRLPSESVEVQDPLQPIQSLGESRHRTFSQRLDTEASLGNQPKRHRGVEKREISLESGSSSMSDLDEDA